MNHLTESQWLSCNDPEAMLRHLGVDENWGYVVDENGIRERSEQKSVLDRQLRLFACACCRRVWTLLPECGRKALEIAEQYADGTVTSKDLKEICHEVARSIAEPEEIIEAGIDLYRADQALLAVVNAADVPVSAWFAAEAAAEAADSPAGNKLKEKAVQCKLIREVFGNPFRIKVD